MGRAFDWTLDGSKDKSVCKRSVTGRQCVSMMMCCCKYALWEIWWVIYSLNSGCQNLEKRENKPTRFFWWQPKFCIIITVPFSYATIFFSVPKGRWMTSMWNVKIKWKINAFPYVQAVTRCATNHRQAFLWQRSFSLMFVKGSYSFTHWRVAAPGRCLMFSTVGTCGFKHKSSDFRVQLLHPILYRNIQSLYYETHRLW